MPPRHLPKSWLVAATGLALALLAIGIFAMPRPAAEAPSVQEATSPSATTTEESASPATQPAGVSVSERGPAEDRIQTATLSVDGKVYPLYAPSGTTLEDAMELLVTETAFTYEARTYTGLGTMITAINGNANTSDHYWILHVNGEKSSVGASQLSIRQGDTIEWKFEKSY